MWDTCTSHFGPKIIDRVGRGRQGRSKSNLKIGSRFQPLFYFVPHSSWLDKKQPKLGFGARKRIKDPSNGPKMVPPSALISSFFIIFIIISTVFIPLIPLTLR